VVVGLAGEDLVGTVQLLKQDHPSELVGEGQRSERQSHVDALKLGHAERSPDYETQVEPARPPRFEKLAERRGVRCNPADVKQTHERTLRDSPHGLFVLTYLNQLKPGVAAQQLHIMGYVVGERRAQTAHGDDHDPHDGILRRIWTTIAPSDKSTSTSNPK